jgi:PAS domain S-box-containing protein
MELRTTAAAPTRFNVLPVALPAALVPIGVGAVTLLGWLSGIESLKGLGGSIHMKANTAIGLVACGLSLLLILRRPRHWSAVAAALAALAGAIGALTLLEHLSGWNLHIDELLFKEPVGAAATASPGRMGPNGALSLVLISIALLSLRQDTPRSVARAQVWAFGAAVLALLALTGYWYGARQLYDIARVTGIAYPTALAFFALSGGILLARPNLGPVTAFLDDRPGSVMARRLLAAAVGLPLAIGYLRVLGQDAALYDTGFGTAVFAIALAITFVLLIWRTARHVNALDTERQHARAEVRESEERFRRLADQAPVMIYLTSTAKQCIWVNQPWLRFVGRTLEQELGEGWAESMHPEDRARCFRIYAESFDARQPFEMEYRVRRYDGSYRWILGQAVPCFAGDAFTGYAGSCLDITDRKELEAQQAAAREAAESANRLKDEFLATLSHELRTPLTAILGYARMMRDEVIAPDKRPRAIEIIERNAIAQKQLVEDLLDISRVTTGRLRLEVEQIPAITPLREAVESVRPAADAKGIAIDLHADPFAGTVNGDAGRLRQVFWNLVSNAVKFTPSGGRLLVALERQDTSVVVTVRDTGIGISREFLPHVFEPFRQADGHFTREYSGLGLGLAICRQLVELHGGTIAAASEGVGRGATFTVTLPLYVGADAEAFGSASASTS